MDTLTFYMKLILTAMGNKQQRLHMKIFPEFSLKYMDKCIDAIISSIRTYVWTVIDQGESTTLPVMYWIMWQYWFIYKTIFYFLRKRMINFMWLWFTFMPCEFVMKWKIRFFGGDQIVHHDFCFLLLTYMLFALCNTVFLL